MKKLFARWLADIWYKDPFIAVWLKPFSMIYHDAVRLRRFLYRKGLLKSYRLAVPVIVAGNISVGGTGKTPLVIWLANYLKQAGFHPGVISRGYGGQAEQWPQWVNKDSQAEQVGDEALLLIKHCACPVAVGPSRFDAGQLLIDKAGCDIVLSDDGLQHYALQRDLEIAVIDGVRRFGNGAFLPGGPLREPISRLQEVDLIVCNGGEAEENEYAMALAGDTAVNLASGERKALKDFYGQSCHALAGIGHPQRFFGHLQNAGLDCITHIFPDHYDYRQQDIAFNDDKPVFMTEKDAVKCLSFISQQHWYVPVRAILPDNFKRALQTHLDNIITPRI